VKIFQREGPRDKQLYDRELASDDPGGKTTVSPLSILKPSESLAEIVAGLIMVLTFTLAASVAIGGGQDAARAALIGAIGCNTAWGIIDAVFYMMGAMFGRSRRIRLARAITSANDEAKALATIRDELDPYLASVTKETDRENLYRSVYYSLLHGQLPQRTGLTRDDLVGAAAVFCLALAAALPAILPLLFIDNPWLALRISNLLVVGLLFLVGYHWAKHTDVNPWYAGFSLTGLGLALVVIAIMLGG
jgi:VIT family